MHISGQGHISAYFQIPATAVNDSIKKSVLSNSQATGRHGNRISKIGISGDAHIPLTRESPRDIKVLAGKCSALPTNVTHDQQTFSNLRNVSGNSPVRINDCRTQHVTTRKASNSSEKRLRKINFARLRRLIHAEQSVQV